MRMILAALAIGLAAFGAVFLLTADRSGSQRDVAAAPAYVQRDSGEGSVEIEVTYATPEFLRLPANIQAVKRYQPDRYAVFLVAMNTHSVNLSAYDMVKVSELKAGGKRYAALRWESTSDNNHHRSGALIFPKVDPRLPAELIIKTIAGVPERIFRWAP